MIQLQTLIADRQQAEALSQVVLAAQQHERFRLEYNWDRPGGDYVPRAECTASRMLNKSASGRRPLFSLFGLSRLLG
jgi:hypothetical protein